MSLSSVKSETALRSRLFSSSSSFRRLTLLNLQPAKLLTPAIVGHLAHTDLPDRLRHALALRDQNIDLAQLRDDLDHFNGGGSPRPCRTAHCSTSPMRRSRSSSAPPRSAATSPMTRSTRCCPPRRSIPSRSRTCSPCSARWVQGKRSLQAGER